MDEDTYCEYCFSDFKNSTKLIKHLRTCKASRPHFQNDNQNAYKQNDEHTDMNIL
ncbi:unnamed protein product [Cunninghamella blakesleeana]